MCNQDRVDGIPLPHVIGWLAASGAPTEALIAELEIMDPRLKEPARVAAFTAALSSPFADTLAADTFDASAAPPVDAAPTLDPALGLALHLAKEAVAKDGPITCDAIVLTVLHDDSCGAAVAIHAVARATHSVLTDTSVAGEMGFKKPSDVVASAESVTVATRAKAMGWTVFHAVEGAAIVPPLAPIPAGEPLPPLPPLDDHDVRTRMAGPTPDCAKLVPCFPHEFSPDLPSPPRFGFGRVFMGRYPTEEADLRHLLQAKVSVFVNLREELADSMYTGDNPSDYPIIVKRLLAAEVRDCV